MAKPIHRIIPWAVTIVVAAVCLIAGYAWSQEAPPPGAARYQNLLTRNARLIWGLDAPVALFAAQIHQESRWNPSARSPFANGIGQFTPATAQWIGTIDPTLASADTGNPTWSIRALVRYDKWLYERNPALTNCDQWGFALSAYNGGEGWLRRDQRLAKGAGANALLWWDNVERYSARALWAKQENRDYPKKILRQWLPMYIRKGWPGVDIC